MSIVIDKKIGSNICLVKVFLEGDGDYPLQKHVVCSMYYCGSIENRMKLKFVIHALWWFIEITLCHALIMHLKNSHSRLQAIRTVFDQERQSII